MSNPKLTSENFWFGCLHFDLVTRGLFESRRVCGKFVLRSQPTSPHSNTLSQTCICSDRELEALAGGQLIARYYISFCRRFIRNDGYWIVTANAWRTLALTKVGREPAQKTFRIWAVLPLCMTYLFRVWYFTAAQSRCFCRVYSEERSPSKSGLPFLLEHLFKQIVRTLCLALGLLSEPLLWHYPFLLRVSPYGVGVGVKLTLNKTEGIPRLHAVRGQ